MDGDPPNESVDVIEQVPSAGDRISGPDFAKNSFSYGTLIEGYNVWTQEVECNFGQGRPEQWTHRQHFEKEKYFNGQVLQL